MGCDGRGLLDWEGVVGRVTTATWDCVGPFWTSSILPLSLSTLCELWLLFLLRSH